MKPDLLTLQALIFGGIVLTLQIGLRALAPAGLSIPAKKAARTVLAGIRRKWTATRRK
ncbi:hypothetical protein [Novosphingobium album (ex Hu et al. 2023)]|uniref:Uncharacterized protein n=1 Tax=Novosphingobium album (ex Hu et al. 2023) TaxID=2930093 RepID=A0ABT0B7K1_9SPHN|nr:hypothetical protein [Novosphingobium album (ex Hu et al. 2023)]MCJ2181042.1 hypothetical protein [Novosphingobium album (ex Hu et al. 2023)]